MKDLFQFLRKGPQQVPNPVKALPVVVSADPDYPWFREVEGDELQQGDIFENCRVYFPKEDLSVSTDKLALKWEDRDLIVISQSCDLAKDQKIIEQVSLCAIWRQSEFKSGHLLSKLENLERVRKEQIPRYHVIASSNISGFEREIRIIDLQLVYSLPITFLRAKAAKERHLRLLPPYREHLSQSFARVYMRVGLPIGIPSFTKK